MDRATSVIERAVTELSKNPDISSIVLVGSRVKGNRFPPDKYSDIEMYVVANDEAFTSVEKQVQSIQHIFGDDVVLAYKNQWAGWSILFKDLLRLEIPVVKESDNSINRSEDQKFEILYSRDKKPLIQKVVSGNDQKADRKTEVEQAIKDFWYMAIYAAQHIARGEIWLARDAVRISMQGKVKRLIQEIFHSDTLSLERDRRIELTWSKEELEMLRLTSCSYDRDDVIRAFWANIKFAEELLTKIGFGDQFSQYRDKLTPSIKEIIG